MSRSRDGAREWKMGRCMEGRTRAAPTAAPLAATQAALLISSSFSREACARIVAERWHSGLEAQRTRKRASSAQESRAWPDSAQRRHHALQERAATTFTAEHADRPASANTTTRRPRISAPCPSSWCSLPLKCASPHIQSRLPGAEPPLASYFRHPCPASRT